MQGMFRLPRILRSFFRLHVRLLPTQPRQRQVCSGIPHPPPSLLFEMPQRLLLSFAIFSSPKPSAILNCGAPKKSITTPPVYHTLLLELRQNLTPSDDEYPTLNGSGSRSRQSSIHNPWNYSSGECRTLNRQIATRMDRPRPQIKAASANTCSSFSSTHWDL